MKYTSHFRRALVPLLAGCATPAVIDTASLPAKPAAVREASTTTAPALQGPWWGVFAAPVLSQLVEKLVAATTSACAPSTPNVH